MAAAGAAIVVAGRNRDKSRRAVADWKAWPPRRGDRVDVTDEASVVALVAQTVERLGRMDVLVNNAGINIRKRRMSWIFAMAAGDRHNLTTRSWRARRASGDEKRAAGRHQYRLDDVHLRRGFAPAYAARRVASCSSRAPWHGLGAPPHPGQRRPARWIDTELTHADARCGLHERVLSRIPEGRWGAGDDLAGVAVFLASRARTTSRGRRFRWMAAIRS